jgi:hypothetical protein
MLAVIAMIAFSGFSMAYIYKSLWKNWNSSYILRVEVDNAGMLALGTPVLMHGVHVGSVKDLYLDDGNVTIELNMDRRVKIPFGSEVKITVHGMIGNLVVNIYKPAKVRGYLKNGDTIKGSGPISAGIVLEKATDIAEQIKNLVKDLDIPQLNKTIKNITDKIDKILNKDIEGEDNSLKNVIDGFSELGKELKKSSDNNYISNTTRSIEHITRSLADAIDKFKLEAYINLDNNFLFLDMDISMFLGSFLISKNGFDSLTSGYSFMLRKADKLFDLRAGMLKSEAGIECLYSLLNNFSLGVSLYNLKIPELNLFAKFSAKNVLH